MKKIVYLCTLVILCVGLTSCTANTNNKTPKKQLPTELCAVEGCNLEVDLDSKYCEEHICGEDNCYEMRVEGSDVNGYCQEHKCKTEGCFNKKIYGREFCGEHLCGFLDCNNKRETGTYCLLHVCKYEGCVNVVVENSQFCIEHKCPVEGCLNVNEGAACKNHQCKAENCTSFPEIKGYCEFHYNNFCVCGKDGCTNEIQYGHVVCDEHNCFAPGCNSLQYKENLCPTHYYQKYPMNF